jgi:hypothetical protein
MASITPLKLNTLGLVQNAQSGDVIPLAFGGVGKKSRASVSQVSGTTVIAVSSTAPLSTDGTQLSSLTVTPDVVGSNMAIEFVCFVDNSTTTAKMTVTVFRNSTLIGYVTVGSSNSVAIKIYDTTTSLSSITYSVRVGATAGTWYVNRSAAATMGGVNKSSFSVREEI